MRLNKFLEGGGEMGELTRSFNWSETSIGAPENWPQSLYTTLSIVLNSKFPMFVWWGDDLIQFYNDAYRPSLGNDGKHPTALGQKGEECWPEIWHIIKPLINQVHAGGEATWSQDQLIPIYRNGKLEDVYWTFSYSPIKDESGKVQGVLVVCDESTDRVISREKAIESERRFRKLIEEAPVPMCLYRGKELIIEVVNEALLETWGRDRSVVGKTLPEAIPELEGQPFLKILDTVYATGEPYIIKNTEAKIVRNGVLQTCYYDLWYKAMYDSEGKINGILATGIDVTDKVKAITKIEESEKNLRNVILQAPVAMCILKGENFIVDIGNARVFELWGTTSEEIIGKPVFDVLPKAREQGFDKLLENVYNTGETFNAYSVPLTLPRKGELTTIYIDFVYEAFKEANGKISGIMAVAIDVTEQVNARNKIAEAEDRTKLAIASADLGTYELNFKTGEFKTSDRLNAIWGVNRTVKRSEFVEFFHPDDQELRRKAHEDSLKTGRLNYIARIVRNDQSIRTVKIDGKVLFDNDGNSTFLLGVVQDITEQKNLQQQKDNFIAMASHELKTPVTSIKAYVHILEQMLIKKGEFKEAGMIARMDSQVNRLNSLITDLLDVTKINTGKLEFNKSTFDFNDLVKEMSEELQRTSTDHKLVVNVDGTIQVTADKERVSQVITNFISNAIKYSPNNELVNVSSEIKGNEVQFSVQDFGIGINKESQQKVFNQFYRVENEKHQSFQGLGLGLYISSEIIKREGGKIWVNSEEGKGSEFYFTLPLDN